MRAEGIEDRIRRRILDRDREQRAEDHIQRDMARLPLDVDAPNYVLSALPVPVAEKGYYVFPVNTNKYVLEQEGY